MSKITNNRRLVRMAAIALVVLCTLALAPLAFSQGCSLCYTQVANSGARMIAAIRNGIIVLIIPPVSMCIGAMILTFRRRNQFHQPQGSGDNGSDW